MKRQDDHFQIPSHVHIGNTQRLTKSYIDAHNKVVGTLWKVNLEISKCNSALRSEGTQDKEKIEAKVKNLKEQKAILETCLQDKSPLEVIQQKLTEVEKLAKIINPDKKAA